MPPTPGRCRPAPSGSSCATCRSAIRPRQRCRSPRSKALRSSTTRCPSRSSTASICASSRVRRWRSSGRPEPARRPSPAWSHGCTTRPRERCASATSTCATRRPHRCAIVSVSSPRTRTCSTTPCGPTSAMPVVTPRTSRSSRRCGRRRCGTSCVRSPMASTRSSAIAVIGCRAARSNASRSPGCS